MEAARISEVVESFSPDEDDKYNVAVVLYDKFKAPTDEDFITCPFKYKTLEGLPPMPEQKPGYEHMIVHQDGRTWEYRLLQEKDDPPEWFPEK